MGGFDLRNYLFIFIGGGIGASCRYWLSGVVYRWVPVSFPFGNLVVNISGCFLIGLLMAAFSDRFTVSPALRIFLVIGILGGFTTFSSFSYETFALFRDNEVARAMLNIAVSVFGCLGATVLGHYAGRLL
jgi:fluoride exporter